MVAVLAQDDAPYAGLCGQYYNGKCWCVPELECDRNLKLLVC